MFDVNSHFRLAIVSKDMLPRWTWLSRETNARCWTKGPEAVGPWADLVAREAKHPKAISFSEMNINRNHQRHHWFCSIGENLKLRPRHLEIWLGSLLALRAQVVQPTLTLAVVLWSSFPQFDPPQRCESSHPLHSPISKEPEHLV